MKNIDDKEAWENLANAIILSAVKDYKRALLHLKRNPDSESAKRAVEREEQFFYSSWFEVLTNLDPSYLIRKMKEMVGV
jgi:hypothetical protein